MRILSQTFHFLGRILNRGHMCGSVSVCVKLGGACVYKCEGYVYVHWGDKGVYAVHVYVLWTWSLLNLTQISRDCP